MRIALMILIVAIWVPGLIGQSLATGLNTQTTEACLAFDVTAAKNLTIDDFSLNFWASPASSRPAFVWKRKQPGSYLPVIYDVTAWELIGSTTVSGGGLLNLGLSLGVDIPAGQTQAFMIFGGFECRNTQPSGNLRAQNTDLSIYYGHGGPLALNPTNPNRGFSGTIFYTLDPALTSDLAVDELISPTVDDQSCAGFNQFDIVTVQLRNRSTQALPVGTILQMELKLDGSLIASETTLTPSMIPAGGTLPYTFQATVNLAQGASHTIEVTCITSGDMDPTNDQLTVTLTAGGLGRVSSFPYVENFDGTYTPGLNVNLMPPPGWYQDPNDWTGFESQIQFKTSNGSFTPGVGHGWEFPNPPISAYLTPIYSASASTPVNAILEVTSPCIDLGLVLHPRLSFWLSWFGSPTQPQNRLSIDVIDSATGLRHVDVLAPISGSVNGAFQEKRVVDLSAFAFQTIRLVFRFDISQAVDAFPFLDDVMIQDGLPTIGQNPQPGFAEFSSEISLNVYNDQPSVMSGGPYYIEKSVGDTFHMDFAGQPSQPILLLSGPLNPRAATYPIIGGMDLGGIPDVNGIPLGVIVVADGTQPGIGSLFNLGPSGTLSLAFSIPSLPPGPLDPFQAAILTGGANGSWLALSNTIVLDIQ